MPIVHLSPFDFPDLSAIERLAQGEDPPRDDVIEAMHRMEFSGISPTTSIRIVDSMVKVGARKRGAL